jgi:hypothetical protein
MEVSDTLKTAWEAVASAGLPERIHEVAFREAVRLLAPAEVAASPLPSPSRTTKLDPGRGSSARNADLASETELDEDVIHDRVATHTGADRALLERLVRSCRRGLDQD